jgi:hypothetical protein
VHTQQPYRCVCIEHLSVCVEGGGS